MSDTNGSKKNDTLRTVEKFVFSCDIFNIRIISN